MYMCAKAYDIDTKGSLGMWEAFCLANEIPKKIDWAQQSYSNNRKYWPNFSYVLTIVCVCAALLCVC